MQVTTAVFERIRADTSEPLRKAVMALLLLATWSLLHQYKGLTLDGELYAFQAMARLNPPLKADVYLMADSQDEFTVFSPLYAFFIRCFGLWNASVVLFVLFAATFLGAAWSAARSLWSEDCAWLSTVACIVIVGGYGAYGVFAYAENYLTARSMAEAMVILALACQLRDFAGISWFIAMAAMLIHPLMALPGLLLLICLSLPILYVLLGAFMGVVAALIIAWLSLHIESGPPLLMLMRGEWLDVVRERSQFLFLQYWHLRDWDIHAHAALCLIIAAAASEDSRVRRLCIAGLVVGITGLVVAYIASNVGPVAILIQGQAWRWFWVAGFLSVLTLAPTALRFWEDAGVGRVCAVLLVASWTFPPVNGTLLVTAALSLWLLPKCARPGFHRFMQLLAYALIGAIFAWLIVRIWVACISPAAGSIKDPSPLAKLSSLFAYQIPALLVAWLGLQWLRSAPTVYASLAVSVLLSSLCYMTFIASIRNHSTAGSPAELNAFSHWRDAIPAESNVLMIPAGNSPAHIWFSLQRPSYLTVGQSAGVVFSPETAQEVRRRSDILLPVMEPDWKIKTQLERAKRERDIHTNESEQTRPLTVQQLSSVCRDPQLGFVIAKERLGFDAIENEEPGQWQSWSLYDCSRVRQTSTG